MLSQVEKFQLLQATLQNLPVYALSLFGIPAKFAEALERIHKTFLWSGVEEKKGLPWSLGKKCVSLSARGV